MDRITDPRTNDLIDSTRLIVEATQSLIIRSKHECELLRATIRQSRRLMNRIRKDARQ